MTSGSTRCATTGIDVGDAGSWAPSLTAAAVGIAAGAKSVADVEHLTEQMPRAMRRRLGIARRVPDTTLRDALCSIEPEQLARCLHTTVRAAERRKAIHADALPFGVVSLDGKGTSISACDDWHAQRQSAGQGAPLVGVVRTITATLISSSARPCIDVMPIPARTNEMGAFRAALEHLTDAYGSLDLFRVVTYDPWKSQKWDDPWKSQKRSRLIASFLTQPEADLQQ